MRPSSSSSTPHDYPRVTAGVVSTALFPAPSSESVVVAAAAAAAVPSLSVVELSIPSAAPAVVVSKSRLPSVVSSKPSPSRSFVPSTLHTAAPSTPSQPLARYRCFPKNSAVPFFPSDSHVNQLVSPLSSIEATRQQLVSDLKEVSNAERISALQIMKVRLGVFILV